MSEETDYSDGKDLKTDSAFQNRDVIKWMERLERAKMFVGAANDVISAADKVLSTETKAAFERAWAAAVPNGVVPSSVVADANLNPPSVKKVHREDGDRQFLQYKEYPFYYVLPVTAMFTATFDSQNSVPDGARVAEWFAGSVSPAISDDVLGKLSSVLRAKFSGLFHFPKGKDDFKEGMMNLVFTSSLVVSLASGGRPRAPILPFRDSADYREMLATELSVAIGRCMPPPTV